MFTKQLLKEKYPKSYELLLKFIGEQLRNVQKLGIPPDTELPEIQKKFVESTVDGLMLGNPRILYDFFDGNGIQIGILPTSVGIFYSYINGDEIKDDNWLQNRVEKEKFAFEKAFEELENCCSHV